MAGRSMYARARGEGAARGRNGRSRGGPDGDASNGSVFVPLLLGGLSLAALYLLRHETPQLKRYMKMRSM